MSFGIPVRNGVGLGLRPSTALSTLRVGGRPALFLNFVGTTALDSRVTFTRGSTATFTGSNGLIQSAAINTPRFDYDPVTLVSKGLLIEDQRTNLLLNSLLNGTVLSTQNVTVTAVAHTISFYGSGTITLTGASTATVVGTGVYPNRRTLTFTPSAGTLTCTVTGSVQYAQLEIGTFASSFIPTAAATVTRSADVATMSGTNFSSWYNQSAGTIFASILSAPVNTIAQQALYLSDGTASNTIFTRRNSSGSVATAVSSGGVTQGDVSAGSAVVGGGAYKYAFAYAVNDLAESVNGSAVGADTSATIPTLSQMNLGASVAGIQYLNGHIRAIAYYRQRLPNATLQALTA